MNNEIKEILDNLNNAKWEKDTEEITYKILFNNEVYKLLDYITNLQEEINKLTAENTEWESKYYEMQDNFHNANEELERLKHQLTNNWNELRQHIKEYLEEWGNSDDEWVKGKCDMGSDILYDMEELKEKYK